MKKYSWESKIWRTSYTLKTLKYVKQYTNHFKYIFESVCCSLGYFKISIKQMEYVSVIFKNKSEKFYPRLPLKYKCFILHIATQVKFCSQGTGPIWITSELWSSYGRNILIHIWIMYQYYLNCFTRE